MVLIHHLFILIVYIHQIEGTLHGSRNVGRERQLKKGVDGRTARIDGGNTRGGNDGALLATMFFYVT